MKKYQIIIDDFNSDPPKQHEINAVQILLDYFKTNIVFIRPAFGKTPDFLIDSRTWELKSPKGGSKNTIGNNLRHARHQSANIILDLSRCSFTDERAVAKARDYLSKYPQNIQNVIIITKHREVLTILSK